MFTLLGKTVTRFWPLLLGGWLLLLGASWRWAPAWDKVTQSGDVPSLPEDTPSRQGERLFRKAFPDDYAGSGVVLILSRGEGATGLQEQDKQFIAQVLVPTLNQLAAANGDPTGTARGKPTIARIRSPQDRGVGTLLLSRDKRAALVLVELTTPFLDQGNWATIEQIEGLVARLGQEQKVPAGLEIGISGSATAGRDMARAELKSAHDVEVWTILVVVALLILTYRSPLVALIPLATVYVAVQVSLCCLGLLAEAQVLSLSRDLRIFITVLAYGAGVDYCVFLIARYQEELEQGGAAVDGLTRAIARAGGAVSASATTVICGIAMMAFARLGKIHQAGLVIPISLVLVLGAALTFAPSLLCLAGRWAFWPQGRTEQAAKGHNRGLAAGWWSYFLRRNVLPDIWKKLGAVLLRRPGLIWLTTVAAMLPFALTGVAFYKKVTYDPLSGLPESAPSVVGTRVLERHFSPGLLGPVTILLENHQFNFASIQGIGLIRELTERLETRREAFGIADLRSAARPLGSTEVAQQALAGVPLPRSLLETLMRLRALAHYVSLTEELKGHVTRIDLVLAVPPLSSQGIEYLDRIEQSLEADLPEGLRQDSQLFFTGPAAAVHDLRMVTRGDQTRIQILVPATVLVLLLLVFRQVVVSLYLILSVLFSYLVTLGLTFVVFWLLEREAFGGLNWKVPLFLFTILVAVGEDYNIFLVSRIEEERKTHGLVQGILAALARTGRIISTCGFIMAGTFAALLAGSFLAMRELGFALAVGVLLDTLVVRPILVPTFLILLRSRRWVPVKKASALVEQPESVSR